MWESAARLGDESGQIKDQRDGAVAQDRRAGKRLSPVRLSPRPESQPERARGAGRPRPDSLAGVAGQQ